MSRLQIIFDELRNITTVDLVYNARCCFEKLLWATIGIIGTIWAFVFFESQFKLWNESPWLTTRAHVHLSQLQYPAITFCSDGATKYAVAERLGNYIDPTSMNKSKDMTNLKILILQQILPDQVQRALKSVGKNSYKSECRKSRNIGCKVRLYITKISILYVVCAFDCNFNSRK